MPHNDDALPVLECASKLAEIEAQIFDLEIQEECVIGRAAKDGIIIERRDDQSLGQHPQCADREPVAREGGSMNSRTR